MTFTMRAPVLDGTLVRLEPLSRRHAADLARSAQGTGPNAEAMLLLFRHAFEVWGVARVDLTTDARNSRPRAAI
ncbi:GNAT family N-acetyltransferase, partial [Streptomyces sp. TRM76130]|nr:GNAT family N-acetyltransferase [Streptomyces sp. TRM76130]